MSNQSPFHLQKKIYYNNPPKPFTDLNSQGNKNSKINFSEKFDKNIDVKSNISINSQGIKTKVIENNLFFATNNPKLDSNSYQLNIENNSNSKKENNINNGKKIVFNDSSALKVKPNIVCKKIVRQNDNNKLIIVKKEILGKIMSKYLLLNIFDYINNSNDLIMKFFVHSKYFQKKLNLSLFLYQKKYFNKIGLNINDYLSGYNDENEIYPDYFDKFYLLNKLKNDGNKIGINSLVYYVTNYIKDIVENKNGDINIYIDIFSPFFDILSKAKNFWEIFTIPININFMAKNHLMIDYLSFFEKMNKTNINYSLLFNYNNSSDIKYLKQFNVDFKNVKKLTIRPIPALCGSFKTYVSYLDPILPKFFETLFSLKDIQNNLVYLKIQILFNQRIKISPNSLLKLNDFKALENLELEGFNIDSKFVLSLQNLKNLSLYKVKNISLDETGALKNLLLYETELIKSYDQSLITMPNLEKLEVKSYGNSNIKRYLDIFDFLSFKNLKIFIGEMRDFLELKDSPLENIKLLSNKDNHLDIEKKAIKKIITLKTLKELSLFLNEIKFNDIGEDLGENNSINKIYLNLESNNKDCILFKFQSKFPNLSDFTIELPDKKSIDNYPTNLNILESDKCKINNIHLKGINLEIQLFCGSFEKLVTFDINLSAEVDNMDQYFPLFNENCGVVFKSLTFFKFKAKYLEYRPLNNLCVNLDKMPNLKHFELYCQEFFQIDKQHSLQLLYENLFEKIKSKKIDYIKIDVVTNLYLKENKIDERKNVNIFDESGIHIYKVNE